MIGAAATALAAPPPSSAFAGERAAGTASSPDRTLVGVCAIGETSPPNTSYNQFDLEQLVTYQLLDPAECSACSGGSLILDQLRWQIRYYSTLCPLTFEVTIVGTDHAPCPRPDTTSILCPPFTYIYLPPAAPPHIVTIPFPPGCCLSAQAFVRIRVTNAGGCVPGSLGFFAAGPCTGACRSYVSYPGFPLEDSCDLIGATPTIAVDADCCNPTPTRRGSWGGMKLHYR